MSSSPTKCGESAAESMRSSNPRTSTNARSKRSAGETKNVQLTETKEANSQAVSQQTNSVDKWVKFTAWFGSMGVLLWYGMSQHNDSLLCWVMILVTVGCGFGNAVEMLLQYLQTLTKH